MAVSVQPTAGTAQDVWRRIGILGGGQLGLMIAEAARRLNVHTTVLDPNPACPASLAADATLEGSFRDAARIRDLAKACDALTVEIEHIDTGAYGEAGRACGIPTAPLPATVALIQDKFLQKQHFAEQGVPQGPCRSVDSAKELAVASQELGYPLMLKARKGAYDGRGNAVIDSAASAVSAVASLLPPPAAEAFAAGQPGGAGLLYVEGWVAFQRELAVMVARSATGECAAYPVVETVHKDSICHVVIAPAPVSDEVHAAATAAALAAVQCLSGAGVFGVELFHTDAGGVLLNEVAPRPHNSGHYTIEACECDQFEQLVRCVLGLPLGSTALRVPAAIMVNVLGTPAQEDDDDAALLPSAELAGAAANPLWSDPAAKQVLLASGVAEPRAVQSTWAMCQRALGVPGAAVHWYGKAGTRPGRKVGHITVTAPSQAEAFLRAGRVLGQGLASEPAYARFFPAPSDATGSAGK